MALATLGIEVDQDVGAQHFRDRATRREETIYILKAVSPDGKWQTAELAVRWNDRVWLARNPRHPFALMRRTWDFRGGMIACLKARPDAPPAPQGRDTPCTSQDTGMVAALRAYGLQLAGEGTLTSQPSDSDARIAMDAITVPLYTLPGGGEYLWRIQDSDPSCPQRLFTGQTYAELKALWHDREWQELNPEHVLSYLAAFLRNYNAALEHMREMGPALVIRRGNRQGIITRHTTPEHRKRIQDGLAA
jgi:hypothetical protein